MSASNPYNGRWRWWYSAIADKMIANPHATLKEIAASLDKTPTTISYIINSDAYKAYLEVRKAEWRERHDFALLDKTARVAEASLDILLETLEKKRSNIPVESVMRVVESSLDRLGYAPKSTNGPAVSVHVQQNAVVAPPVDATLLAEARQAMRAVEARRAREPLAIQHQPSIEIDGDENVSISVE